MARTVELPPQPADKLLRIRDVLARVPVSRASWWNGVKEGRYPAAVKLGPRTSCWRSSEIDRLIQSL
jgi:prophage regulatory protein